MPVPHRLTFVLAALLALAAFATGARAQAEPEAPPLPSDLKGYIRALIEKQLAPGEDLPAYRYRMVREVKKGLAVTQDCVETERFVATRLLEVNGSDVGPERRKADDLRLAALATDPQTQRDVERAQREEADRINKLMRALPDAFLFSDGGLEQGADGVLRRRIDFRPDPEFRPPSRETMALKGMAGSFWVDVAEQRLDKVAGKLVKSVSFGWGFLGKLQKGGRFLVEYRKTDSGRWVMTAMDIDFRAKLLLGLSSAHLLDRRSMSDFERVGKRPKPEDGVHLLRTVPARQGMRAAAY